MGAELIRIKNLTLQELRATILKEGEPAFRAQQIFKWVYQKRIDTFDAMTTMSKVLRARFAEQFTIKKLEPRRTLVSEKRDAVKFTFRLCESDHSVECVLLYDGKRRTACLSSQLGCGLGCIFCVTGKMGFIRNLTQEEILGQLIGINDYLADSGDKPITNIVFMGMGEALSNFEIVERVIRIIMHEDAFNLGGRKITVSTAGVVPSIERLMSSDLNVGLAISLNAYSDEERSRLMPVNRRYPIGSLVAIARRFYRKTGRRVTFEYVLIEGKTDTREAIAALYRLLGGFPCKINLIPVNPGGGTDMIRPPSIKKCTWFAEELHRKGLSATMRKSRGRDISGACGQLAGEKLQ